jgi:hypothetical protein
MGSLLGESEMWSLVELLLALLLAERPATPASADERRQTALDVVKLLDAVLCSHASLVARFLSLPRLPAALSLLLLRSADAPVRRQTSLLLHDLCRVDAHAGPTVQGILQALLPQAVAHAAHSCEYAHRRAEPERMPPQSKRVPFRCEHPPLTAGTGRYSSRCSPRRAPPPTTTSSCATPGPNLPIMDTASS